MSAEKWLSVGEISEHLGVSKETLYRWLERREIPSHRIGKLWKFKPSEVDQWVMSGGADSFKKNNQKTVQKNGILRA